mmetsp:Transcript_54942/g.116771  ORF Transcript_54942/g.116771 Transcript_54942/m.116771 type:complete len:216 (+) Transcript_54942:1263-1910(+)
MTVPYPPILRVHPAVTMPCTAVSITITRCPAHTLALLRICPNVSSLKLLIFRESLRCIAEHNVAGVTLTMRHRGWYLSCFRLTYLAWLKAVFDSNVAELEMRAATIWEPGVDSSAMRPWTASWVSFWEVLSSTRLRLSLRDTLAFLSPLATSSSYFALPSILVASFAAPIALMLLLPSPSCLLIASITPSGAPGSRSSPSTSGIRPSLPTSITVP